MASPLMAGSTPDLTLDQEAYRRAMQRQDQFFERALDDSVLKEGNAMIRSGNAAVTGSEIQDRMNPYLEQVLGRIREDMNEQNRIAAAGRAASRGGMRGFGSRGALGEAVARDQEEERLATTMAGQRFQGFQSAQQQVNTERDRNITAGQTLGSLDINNRSMMAGAGGNLMTAANQMMDTGQRERSIANIFENDALEREKQRIGILSGMGGLQQTQMQGSIDASQGLYGSIQQYPYGQLGFGNSILPGATGQTQVQDTGRNIFGQLLGTGLSIAGLGLPGGGTVGGKLFMRRGGRVGALRMANGGAVPSAGSFPGPIGAPAPSGVGDPMEAMFLGTSDEELRYLQQTGGPEGDPQLMEDARLERLRREDQLAVPMGRPDGPLPPTLNMYPQKTLPGLPPRMPTEAPLVAPHTAVPRTRVTGPGIDEPIGIPQGPLRALGAQPKTPPPEEEPGMFRQLLNGALEVDPYTGRSMLFDVGLNMIEASSSPTPGRGLLGNLATSIKGANAGRDAARDTAIAQGLERRKAEASILRAEAEARKRNSTIGQMYADLETAQAAGRVDEAAAIQSAIAEELTKGGDVKATGLIATVGDNPATMVLRDAKGDYIYQGGAKTYLDELGAGGFSVGVARPTEVPAGQRAKAQSDQAATAFGIQEMNLLEDQLDNLSDADLGIVGATRGSVASAFGTVKDVLNYLGIPGGSIADSVMTAVGDPDVVRTVPVLEETLFAMVRQQRTAERGRAPSVAEEKTIRDMVQLQGLSSSDSVRAKAKLILENLRRNAYGRAETLEPFLNDPSYRPQVAGGQPPKRTRLEPVHIQ